MTDTTANVEAAQATAAAVVADAASLRAEEQSVIASAESSSANVSATQAESSALAAAESAKQSQEQTTLAVSIGDIQATLKTHAEMLQSLKETVGQTHSLLVSLETEEAADLELEAESGTELGEGEVTLLPPPPEGGGTGENVPVKNAKRAGLTRFLLG